MRIWHSWGSFSSHEEQNAVVVHIYALVLKRHLFMLPSHFHDGVCEGDRVKAIGHHPLYAYEGASWDHHFLCPLTMLR
ncbi:hypothetical protein AT237_07900 [Bartonella henselae]|nr:hypothetical protein AT237_07900 [Bartonella henselae]OLL44785.1 hypothetical protein AT242_07885 [Bartonella henselae]